MENNTNHTGLMMVQKRTQAAAFGSPTVECDMCTDAKQPASKSCMQCMVSYCPRHLRDHYGDSPLRKHKLTEPVENLQESMCLKHNEVKKIFCQTDQQCICYLCHMDEHKGHDAVSAEAEVKKKKKKLNEGQQRENQNVLERNIALLQQELKAIDESADKVLRETEPELRQLIEQKIMNLTDSIKQQRKLEKTRVQDLLHEFIVERDRNAELEQLSRIESHTQFLKKCSAFEAKWKDHRSPSIPVLKGQPLQYFEQVSEGVSELNRCCIKTFKKLKQAVTEVDVLLSQNPQTNDDFLQYSYQLTLDQNTVSKNITLTEKKQSATSMKDFHIYPEHSDRFLDIAQVLSTNALPPRCYWEVEWTGHSIVVGVAYKDIKRDGPDSEFGKKDKSWVLECQNKKIYIYKHNGVRNCLSACESNRVGVFLDHKAGSLCFYEVSETNKCIHKVKTTFTKPLYAGLGLSFYNVTARMCVKEVMD